jgi:hypothetical protein
MATGFGDLFTYGLAIAIILFSLVVGIFDNAGIGPSYTAPSFQYNESSVLLITGADGDSSSGTGYDQATDLGSVGFWSLVDGFKTVLTDLTAYLGRFGVPVIIAVPFQMFVWVICGYEMLMLKKIIWG